uniref:Uncharacterized protein n=1 Tax=Nelumbo nucifera TaxID=4432 RepID=A0A822XJY2_NELNU|nr:TPA_asm: hypothetical protein HUJ06_022070 [Nelumbo nucifera]
MSCNGGSVVKETEIGGEKRSKMKTIEKNKKTAKREENRREREGRYRICRFNKL